ncbi:LysR family transcriptional regulator [Oscillibacter sp. MSJ-2]|uniref:LysR family transcriptional regulator n=1 Tax=Dysosmobacter acutus TaxID=2841504 RepID=A0ABS6FCD3_9FIRM|nr:LysR family transcriptional regulator [Dysosmobacter acutus]MBU5627948.1 LysR family transcriptional regulator [Dysosmobacter acutus]
MISRYGIFCKVVELNSFTRAAELLGYSQSSVSQTVRVLEQEVGVTLIERRKDGVRLTPDGAQYYPYLLAIHTAENALVQKQNEMAGLQNSTITIGTFTSISRTLLPSLMKSFQQRYPAATFVLRQGDYNSIGKWIREGSVDFGFVNRDAVEGVELSVLYEDEMMAALPPGHLLAKRDVVSLGELAAESFILLDEGEYSVPLTAFAWQRLTPQVKYKVYDDYTILAMTRQGLGVSLVYQRVVEGFEQGLEIRPVRETPKRIVALAWKNRKTMPYAARQFADFILRRAAGQG